DKRGFQVDYHDIQLTVLIEVYITSQIVTVIRHMTTLFASKKEIAAPIYTKIIEINNAKGHLTTINSFTFPFMSANKNKTFAVSPFPNSEIPKRGFSLNKYQ
ncbi:16228_t:CDS:2, partial [Funneliformis caledonium]